MAKFRYVVYWIFVVLAFLGICYLIPRVFLGTWMDWKPAIESPEAAAALILTLGGAFTFWLTKRKDREAAIKKEKFEQYKDFITAFSEYIAERGVAGLEQRRVLEKNFAIQRNRLMTFASENVLNKLREYNEWLMMQSIPIKDFKSVARKRHCEERSDEAIQENIGY